MRETIITIPYNDSLLLYILILIKKRKTTWISLQRNLNPKRFHPFDSGNEKDRNFHSKFQISEVHANGRKGGEERENKQEKPSA